MAVCTASLLSRRRLGEKELAKNYIYDGLITSTAEKSGAEIIYT